MSFSIRTLLTLTVAVCTTFALATSQAGAVAGDIDTSFGAGGSSVTDLGVATTAVNGLAVQADGKYVVAGTKYVGSVYEMYVARFTESGALDPTFAGTGIIEIPWGWAVHQNVASGVVIQPDGKIVVAGSSIIGGDKDFVIARYLPDGQLDTDFSADGKVNFNFNGGGTNNDEATSVALAPDGRILVGGSVEDGSSFRMGVVSFQPNGSPSNIYSGGPKLTALVGVENSLGYKLLVGADASIIVLGVADGGSSGRDLAMVKFTPTGQLDANFGSSAIGKVRIPVTSGNDTLTAAALTPDGKIVAVGSTVINNQFRAAILRFNANGILDTGFSGSGIVLRALAAHFDYLNDAAALADGKLVLAGMAQPAPATPSQTMLVRFNPTGEPDPTFGSGGVAQTGETLASNALRMAVLPDGRMLTAGTQTQADLRVFLQLRRFQADPVPLAIAFKSSLKGKLKASKVKAISGTAAGTGLARVQIAIGKPDSKLLKKSKRCRFVSNSKAKMKKYKSVKGKCAGAARWLTAKGTADWTYALKARLGKGKYTLYARAIGPGGVAQAKTITRSIQIR